MRSLTVLYDARCGLCSNARRWLEGQAQIVPLELLPADSAEARRRYPTLADTEPEELVVVSDEGDVYRGSHAWIVCLWALQDYASGPSDSRSPRSSLARDRQWVSTPPPPVAGAGLMSDQEIALAVSAEAHDDGGCTGGRTR